MALMPEGYEELAGPAPEESETKPSGMKVRRLSDVAPEPIRWLWPGRIARGKPTVIAGDPGLGKSQITASITAITTTGGQWPVDRTKVEPGNVVILSAEDDAADTIRPRLDAAGADVDRIYVIDAAIDGNRERHVNLARDIERLGQQLGEIGDVSLVIIDPISAYLGGTDSHKTSDVRELLAPLGALAAEHASAFILISHLNKSGGQNALSRVTGSGAFVAAARAAYIVSKDPDDDSRRLFLPAKNNIGPDTSGLAYRIEPTNRSGIESSCIVWDADPVTITADEAVAPAEDRSATDEARDLLLDLLKHGSMAVREIKEEAERVGLTEKALRRARESLGIKPEKVGPGWRWELPEQVRQDAQLAPSQNGASWGTFAENSQKMEDAPIQQGAPSINSEDICGSQGVSSFQDAPAGDRARWGNFERDTDTDPDEVIL